MTRPSLLHPLTDRRRPRRARKAAAARKTAIATLESTSAPVPTDDFLSGYDIAARRVRDAGGPIDEATYSCTCGYVFAASVTTSVCCPHCGARQAW